MVIFFSFFISGNVSEIDSEKSVHDENILLDLNITQESEISAVSTKTAETKTGNVLYDIIFRQRKGALNLFSNGILICRHSRDDNF